MGQSSLLVLKLVAFVVLLSGCEARVKDYVKEATRPKEPSVVPPTAPVNVSNWTALKVSPGKMSAVSADGQARMDATVTPTKQRVAGGGMSAELTVGQTRVSAQ